MRDVFETAAAWAAAGTPFSLATLVATRDATPAPIGVSMAVNAAGKLVGDIGAGCSESEIVEAAARTATDGRARLLAIDLTSDDALTGVNGCGGTLEIVTWRPASDFAAIASAIVRGRSDVTLRIDYERDGAGASFETVVAGRRPLLVVGGTTLAREIAGIAARLDFRTVVVDPRPAFATAERLGTVDEIVVAWPDEALPQRLSERTPLLVLSHDPKIDLPALRAGIESRAPYIGLLGSRRAQAGRRDALRAEGYAAHALARIHGPVGLDLGGATVAETAVAIVAEIIATTYGRSGGPLVRHDGAIHNPALVTGRTSLGAR